MLQVDLLSGVSLVVRMQLPKAFLHHEITADIWGGERGDFTFLPYYSVAQELWHLYQGQKRNEIEIGN